jgi:hypothetical protein
MLLVTVNYSSGAFDPMLVEAEKRCVAKDRLFVRRRSLSTMIYSILAMELLSLVAPQKATYIVHYF